VIKRDRFVLLNITFAFNILALVTGILGFPSNYNEGGSTALFFGIVLIVAPVLSIVVVVDRRWTKSELTSN
jgi:hypothetical protein